LARVVSQFNNGTGGFIAVTDENQRETLRPQRGELSEWRFSGKGLEVIADVLGEWFREPAFRGCAFINTVAESGSSAGEDYRIALAHKNQLAAYVESLAKRLDLARTRKVTEAAMIVIEGAIVRAQMTGGDAVIPASRGLLKSLMQGATKSGKAR
jgi:hypothetical protein